jgi:hypothetical protein
LVRIPPEGVFCQSAERDFDEGDACFDEAAGHEAALAEAAAAVGIANGGGLGGKVEGFGGGGVH